MKQVFFFYFIFFSFTLAESEAQGLSYINELRVKAKMTTFNRNSILDEASINHSNYLKANKTGGHIERQGATAFTGKTPDDRAIYVGYSTKSIGENVSTGHPNIESSIDNLMTAIYHRIGFLSFFFNELGLSKVSTYYTYLMSNNGLNELCRDEESERSGQLICDRKKAFAKDRVNGIKEQTGLKNPKFVIWPPANSDNNPPYFYEESPDPLPNYDVSGNPIHIRFNPFYHKPPITLKTFKLLDDKGVVVNTISRSKKNEINAGFLDELTFILFPKKRLKWNTTYKVQYDFTTSTGEKIAGTSNFKTTSLGDKVYSIGEGANTELRVKANTDYILDIIPLNPQDVIVSKGYSSGGTATKNSIEPVSGNTLKVNLSGANGSFYKLLFSNGSRVVKLTLAETDDINADDESLPNDGETMTMNYTKGWNLSAIPGKSKINNIKNSFKNFIVLYTYNGNSFILNPASINYDESFFVYYNEPTPIKLPLDEEYEISKSTINKKWNLVPIGKDIPNTKAYFNATAIYIMENSQYKKTTSALKRGQSAWIYKQ